jgi:predicted RNA binding protein YcfA (HicA-like mRNA interferase family)
LPALPRVSGREAARAFASVGYEIVRQRGSHLRLRHATNARVPLTVPDHAELKTGLLRALIRDSGMTVESFIEALGR